jgi:hypothetical protein
LHSDSSIAAHPGSGMGTGNARDKGHIVARLTRKANGATLWFQIRAVPPGDASEFIGVCAAQGWEPNPSQFDVGTGTALLNGK